MNISTEKKRRRIVMSWHLLSYKSLNRLPVLDSAAIFFSLQRYRGKKDGWSCYCFAFHISCSYWMHFKTEKRLKPLLVPFVLWTICFGFSRDELSDRSYTQMTGCCWLELWWISFLTCNDPSKHLPLFITPVMSEHWFMTNSLQNCLHSNGIDTRIHSERVISNVR